MSGWVGILIPEYPKRPPI